MLVHLACWGGGGGRDLDLMRLKMVIIDHGAFIFKLRLVDGPPPVGLLELSQLKANTRRRRVDGRLNRWNLYWWQ